MKKSLLLSSLMLAAAAPLHAAPQPVLEKFQLQDRLTHRWDDELVHFDFNVPGNGELNLTDAQGRSVPFQFSGVSRAGNKTKGQVWTLASLEPGGKTEFQLRAGKAAAAPSGLKLEKKPGTLVVSNSKIALLLPLLPGAYETPRGLTSVPPPLLGVRGQEMEWLGGAKWFDDGATLKVKEATTTVRESGPVRAVVEQRVVFTNGTFHTTAIELGLAQDTAIIREDGNVNNPRAGWRLSMQPGLNANHVFWHNQWKKTENAETYSLANTAVKFDGENTVAKLRPWSFWWNGDITLYAGFYKEDPAQNGKNPFVGILMINPSRWTPGDWDGFDRLEIPIKAGPNGRLDMDFAFLANTVKDAPSKPKIIMREPDPSKWEALLKPYKEVLVPLHREWAITAGTVADHVREVKPTMEKLYAGNPEGITKMRRQMIKYSEYPLDEVKDYGFDFHSSITAKKRPFLLVSDADIARTRRLAETNPAVKAQVEAAKKYIASSGAIADLEAHGASALENIKYSGVDYNQKLPEAYFGSADPIYGKLLAASVKNLTQSVRRVFLEVPTRPGLASYGPWPAEEFSRLLLAYDLVAGKGLLTDDEERAASDSLVFGAQTLGNPDYWSLDKGLASANPNMTSMIRLPLGLLGLYLAGHPKAEVWSKDAEDELKLEISDWIGPNGAWVECPGYQGASLDGVMLYATAVRNVHGRDYSITPKFKAMMEYFGYLLTPPDPRLPLRDSADIATMSQPGAPQPASLVSIGDTPIGSIYPFNGWMAALTAKSDPEYSKRQQFFWHIQNYHFNNGNRAKGMTLPLTDASLPWQPPSVLSRGFPGFGSLMRTSWTDPKASFIAHRTGPFSHHYHNDFNSIVYIAKGAPLCLDFGNQYVPVRREEPWYHNRVSFNTSYEKNYEDNWKGIGGDLEEMRALPSTLDYSYGKSFGRQGQEDHRYVLMIKSDDPMGANYVVMRDATKDGNQAGQQFYWNLWCLSKEPQINGNVVHFPGQLHVDLDVHMLSPKAPQFTTDFWKWQDYKHVWATVKEEQYGIRVQKSGSAEDYVAVLYPRAQGQQAAEIIPLLNGAGMRIGHMEGSDTVLLSPGKTVALEDGTINLQGEIAFVRHTNDGGIRLAVVRGDSSASSDGWSLRSKGAVSLQIKDKIITGESSGDAHEATITLPKTFTDAQVLLDGKAIAVRRDKQTLTFALPAGEHTFTVIVK